MFHGASDVKKDREACRERCNAALMVVSRSVRAVEGE